MSESETSSTDAAAAQPQKLSIFERMRGLTQRKIKSARQRHAEFARMVAAGDDLSEKQLAELHGVTGAAGYTDDDFEAHVQLFKRRDASKEMAKTLPAALAQVHHVERDVQSLQAQIDQLVEKMRELKMRQMDVSMSYSNASSHASQLPGLEARIQELAGD